MNSTDRSISFKINGDSRGKLLPIEFSRLPFTPQRIFITFGVPNGETRGKHASRTNRQILFCTGGRIHASFTRRGKTESVVLNCGDYYFVESMTWNELVFYENACLVSICSKEYDPSDYIADYEEFLQHD
jgi:hypothetical protein